MKKLKRKVINMKKNKKILFVCTGNTCRSPMAEGIFNSFIEKENKKDNIKAYSAGVFGFNGSQATKNAIDACKEIGVDLTEFKSTSLPSLNVDEFEEFYVMGLSHKTALMRLGVNEEKITILGKDGKGILDPFGGDIVVYRKCRDEIAKEIEKIIENL